MTDAGLEMQQVPHVNPITSDKAVGETTGRPQTSLVTIQPQLPVACLQQKHAAACEREGKGLSLRNAKFAQRVLAGRAHIVGAPFRVKK